MWSSLVLWLSLACLGAAVRCPNGQVCDEGTSCCELPGGGSGCCPQPQAVHDSLPMTRTQSGNDLSENLCPNSASCPPEYTCLQTPQGSYSCCPLPKAVSCDDGRHCCPRGFQCSSDGRSCLQRPVSSAVNAVICPDGESECPNESTCCQMPDQSWGCCPMPQATCCNDKVHCCPHNTQCDLAHAKCTSADGEKPMWTKFAARKRAPWEDAPDDMSSIVTCPDASTCPDGSTCCQFPNLKYGCCPIVSAICCIDKVHCCPPGTHCDLSYGKCSSEAGDTPLLIKSPSQELPFTKAWALKELAPATVKDVKCDDTISCPDKQTCCRLSSGEWGCCPLEEAVCCLDHLHCCPKGTTCDTAHGSCNANGLLIPWVSKTRVQESPRSEGVQCDPSTQCNNQDTCCKTASGGWACCPLQEAVCCKDHLHCCPNGYTCDPEKPACILEQTIPWFNRTSPHVAEKPTRATVVQCDETSTCADGNTCCRSASGEWACCPLAQAVCCLDHVHCCPNGYTCNVEEGTCNQGDQAIPWLTKTDAHLVEVAQRSRDVPCDDTSSCPDGSTCCRSPSGEWACCPLPNAVCCSDHVHCCPNGYTCDVAKGSCNKGEDSVPLFTKTRARGPEVPPERSVPCDETHSCADGSTCCRTTSGDWACCPLPNAVCCSDHVHCCPSGYTCNVEQGSCLKGDTAISFYTKTPARVQEVQRSRDVPCDDTSRCPDGNTCCRQASGGWGCCPLEKAVCCSDHVHCCPSGYTCNVEQGSCLQGDQSIPLVTKTTALSQDTSRSRNVPCDDKSSCSDGSTCCRQASGEWGCCPLEKAVCCDDHVHCCPSGYTCDVAQGTCNQGDRSLPWLTKRPAHVKEGLLHSGAVRCDESSICPDSTTCCKTAAGTWACCPLPQAVCCSDHVHCCPFGYSCDVAEGSCIQGNLSVTWHTKNDASVKEESPLAANTKCDDTTACPGDSTCCKSVSSEWACCPLLKAVCCPDGFHCCPSGYRCDGDSCIKDKALRWDGGFSGNVKMKIL